MQHRKPHPADLPPRPLPRTAGTLRTMDIAKLLAGRTRNMEASAVREILKVASSPGVISLAGGLPAAESFPLEIMEELTGSVLAPYGATALPTDPTQGFRPLPEPPLPPPPAPPPPA